MKNKKIGRPTDNKKDDIIKVRVSNSFKQELNEFIKKNNIKNISDLVRISLQEYINKD